MEISKNARARAQATIREKIEKNGEYTAEAEKQANEQVEKLIRLFNSDVNDIKVEVKFFDE